MLAASRGREKYIISGIYQCANDMGANIRMSREGYDQIGEETANMWCMHYFLQDVSKQSFIVQTLENNYGGNVYLHENSWPGLYGILSAMQLLIIFLYGIVVIFISTVTVLTGNKLLSMERNDMGIYQTLGFHIEWLRSLFALRFGIVAFIGSMIGAMLSMILTDPLVATLMRMFGISDFTSNLSIGSSVLPVSAVVGCFVLFSWLAAGRLKKIDLVIWINMEK